MVKKIHVRTWLDTIASRLGVESIIDRLPFDVAPSVFLVSVFLFYDAIVSQILKEVTGVGSATVFKNPFWLAVPVGMLAAVYVTRDLHRRYQQALHEMHIAERTDQQLKFEPLIDNRIRWVIFVVGAGFIITNTFFFVGVPVILRNNGIFGLVGNFVIVPFVYVPVATDFIATYLGLQIILPRRIRNSDITLDFLDPEGVGGLRPVGELVKHSYYYIMVGMIGLASFVYGPWVFTDMFTAPVKPSPLIDAVFTISWLLAVGTLAYALYVFHRFMKRQKREKLFELNKQYRELMDDAWDIAEHQRPEENSDQIERLESRMDRVSNTREYPATFAMWTQLIIGAILPKAIQLLLANI